MLFASIVALVLGPRTVAPDDDAALAARVGRGDAEAMRCLYQRHHEHVRAFARRMLKSHADAEDLVQEVFLSARTALRGFEGRSSVRTFLVSIAVNHVRHARRSTARRLGALERLHAEPRSATEAPDAIEERKQLAARMQTLLDELPFDQRLAIVLCVIEERTSVEAAEIVGVPEATIRTRVFHGRKKMRELLAQTPLANDMEVVR